MLEKSKGNRRVGKLYKILLYEADFNMNNKHIGSDMMQTVEKGEEQYGNMKRKTAILHSLNKRLTSLGVESYHILVIWDTSCTI